MDSPSKPDAPVDFERLREISDNDAEMMDELISLYIEQTQEFLETLENAIAAQDFDQVRKVAHKAVGGSATCGMNAIIPFLRDLETSGLNQNLENADEVLAGAKSAFDEIQAYLVSNRDQL